MLHAEGTFKAPFGESFEVQASDIAAFCDVCHRMPRRAGEIQVGMKPDDGENPPECRAVGLASARGDAYRYDRRNEVTAAQAAAKAHGNTRPVEQQFGGICLIRRVQMEYHARIFNHDVMTVPCPGHRQGDKPIFRWTIEKAEKPLRPAEMATAP